MGRFVWKQLTATGFITLCLLVSCWRPTEDVSAAIGELSTQVGSVVDGEVPSAGATIAAVTSLLRALPVGKTEIRSGDRSVNCTTYILSPDERVAELTLPVKTNDPNLGSAGSTVKVQVSELTKDVWVTLLASPSRDGEATRAFLERQSEVRCGVEIHVPFEREAERYWVLMRLSMDDGLQREFSRSEPSRVESRLAWESVTAFIDAFERAHDR